MCGPSLRKVVHGILKVIEREQFWHMTLVPVSIGFFCCSGRMCGSSLKKVGQGILELLIGNEKVTGGQTERQTDRNGQSNIPSF